MAKIDKDAVEQVFNTSIQEFERALMITVRQVAPDLSEKALAKIAVAARKSAFTNLLMNGSLMHQYAIAAVSRSREQPLAKGRELGTKKLRETAKEKRECLGNSIEDYIKNNTEAALLEGAEGITSFIMKRMLNEEYASSTVLQSAKREIAKFRKERKVKK